MALRGGAELDELDARPPGKLPGGATPLMRQYRRIKDEHRDKILLFHLGDFYEMFDEDARTASRVLGIALTSRSKGDGSVPLAGFPCAAAREYIEKLLAAGLRVAICDQVEDPALAKGLVRREVTRVITPGTLLDEGLLRPDTNNYLAALAPGREKSGLAFADLSTGEFAVAELTRAEIETELARIRPAEILLPESVRDEEEPYYGRADDTDRARPTYYPDWAFDTETARRKLLEHLRAATLEAFGCESMPLAQAAAGALLRYLEETHRAGMEHMSALQVIEPGEYLAFDGEALRNLEVLETIRERRKEGSLLGVLDRTRTAPGGRRLRQWLARPLAAVEPIRARHEAVGELVREQSLRARLRTALARVQDLERLASRLAAGRVNARDLLGLAESIEAASALAQEAAGASAPLLRATLEALGRASGLAHLPGKIRSTLRPDAPSGVREGGLIADGVSEELDRLRKVRAGGRSWIAEFQAREAERTGISSLKVGYNKVFGYYIEVTRSNLHLVPPEYERKQTLVGAERFVTPELRAREAEVLGAEEKIVALEYRIFCELRDEVAKELHAIRDLGAAVGDLDALASLAEVAADRGYVRPEVDESLVCEIQEGRHPVLDSLMEPGRLVPNDLSLDAEKRQILVVTGPNMAGKSTYIRMCALVAVMAQAGSFVPAARARVGLVDRLFARVGASDDIARGRSTFMVEMVETARVLRAATKRSLVVLDEVGRGTSTYDGVSIAWAVTEHLHEVVGCRTLFATHYHELCAIADELPRVANVNVAVREWGDEITFLYRIVPGGADRSYGIHVARLAGVPREVIGRAREVLALLESRGERASRRSARPRRAKGAEQMPLLAPDEPPASAARPRAPSRLEEALRALKVEEMTPVQALVELERLKRLLEEEPKAE